MVKQYPFVTRACRRSGAAWGPDQPIILGRAPQGAHEVALDESTASDHGFSPGDRMRVLFGGGSEEFVVSGLLKPGAAVASTLVAIDLPTAQRVLERRTSSTPSQYGATRGSHPRPFAPASAACCRKGMNQ